MNLDELREFREQISVMPTVVAAYALAERLHGRQIYGTVPYVYHLLHVAQIAVEFEFDTETWLIACLTHDLIEDTGFTLDDLEARFGAEVRRLVAPVTGDNSSGRENHVRIQHEKIEKEPSSAWLKSFDRLSHLRNLADHWGEFPEKYVRLARMYSAEADLFENMVRGKISPALLEALQDARAEVEELLERESD